ncbi:transcription factor MYB124-like isoform X2 [Primulina eburnea]|uniref:transcription factor MYB124-like isoform X2 n=1 Tax=Primulina eburnea TaxID=1245227 RepID=UPI003C6C3C07
MKKNLNNNDNNSNRDGGGGEMSKQKERHIVSWSPEEDDILREQIRVLGTENWTIIASKFQDKTTRQCRRRWFTYLNSDFKKGGWSPEEDMLLCEAQKIFGNRWTEIAKVVSGRTDNAVKNRFNTLCKKRAKHEALAKENSNTSYINLNNKRIIFPNGLNTYAGSENAAPLKKIRTSNTAESCYRDEKLTGEYGNANHLLRPPFAAIAQNFRSCEGNLASQLHDSHMKEVSSDGSYAAANDKRQGTFLKKDDPKVLALMQQAELLGSLAIKVNSEKTEQSLENAWMVLQDFLKQNKESDLLTFKDSDTRFQLKKFKELMENVTCSNECSDPSRRQSDMYESSPTSSEYSTGSTLVPNALCDKTEDFHADICALPQNTGQELQSDRSNDQHFLAEESGIYHGASIQDTILSNEGIKADDGALCEFSNAEFSSPAQVTPMFRALAATIPSPKFSESEKHFLMKALGMDSTTPSPKTTTSQAPPCKRSLLHCL